MTDKTQSATAAEDLAYIRRIMEETRRAVFMRGDYFIVWGVAVLFGLIGNYVFIRIVVPPSWAWAALWGGLSGIAWAVTVVFARRDACREHASSPVGRMLGALWGACGIAIVLVCFVGVPLGVTSVAAIGPTIAAIVGIGVFLTGVQMGAPWVRNLAFGWWLAAVAEFIWIGEQLLIAAVIVVLFEILPGFMLNAQARKLTADKRA